MASLVGIWCFFRFDFSGVGNNLQGHGIGCCKAADGDRVICCDGEWGGGTIGIGPIPIVVPVGEGSREAIGFVGLHELVDCSCIDSTSPAGLWMRQYAESLP